MRYKDFERIVSAKRIRRYVEACGGDTRKAMTLYRYNVELAQTMFSIIGYFEVALRNAINDKLTERLGEEWLKDSVMAGGVFAIPDTHKTQGIIYHAYQKLNRNNSYSHTKLLAEMEFGVWKYMFSPVQFRRTDKVLMRIFPYKTKSTRKHTYDRVYIFNELDKINTLRNRIAHHEPICFPNQQSIIYTDYILTEYNKILTLCQWMGIECKTFFYGLDHVQKVCKKIDKLKPLEKQYPPV